MFKETNNQLRLALVAVVALIATGVVALSVVLSHDGTTMAKQAWASKPSAATSSPATGASSSPTGEQTSPVARNSSVSPPPRSTQPERSTSPAGPDRAPLTYTVKRGDNLTVIADWFKLRGYGDLYERNRKIIGANPNLIRPGQKITVSSAGMSTSS